MSLLCLTIVSCRAGGAAPAAEAMAGAIFLTRKLIKRVELVLA